MQGTNQPPQGGTNLEAMTLTEYYNQTEPKSGVCVELSQSDYNIIFDVPGGKIIGAHICGRYYQYFMPTGTNKLYTMDQDGNKKTLSVFTLKTTKK